MQPKIAYFSAEFGLSESLPIYSGGLGVLAGDHVKAANDLELPLVGVGVLYRRGYFQQRILEDGSQDAQYPPMNPEELPVQAVLDGHGHPLFVEVPLGNRLIYLRVWQANAGNVPIYLMDADNDRNSDQDRRLTDRLYGGDQETRIAHEVILGIGGVRVLRAIGFEPDVWHMNEGHVAFLALERIREYSAQGVSFETALEAVKASTVFTTHTPVPAGHDQFSFELMDRYLGDYFWQLGADRAKILGLGRHNDKFNMTRLAFQTASKVNGVSKLHAEVTKELFHKWCPDIPPQDIPVEAVTNGVHTETWLSPELSELYNQHLAYNWPRAVADPQTWVKVEEIPDDKLWGAHQSAKQRMTERLSLPNLQNVLTIGFARRFATYKRAYLLFQDLDRLERIVNHPDHPVAFVFAGKAHPADHPGQELIRRIVEVSKMEGFQGKVFLVENYDMNIGRHLVQGVDVWLNTPVKPMEASGTSGIKAALNGVPNCSVLDGWWDEGYNGENGWAIEGKTEGGRGYQDWVDGETLYRVLETEIAPLYYRRGEGGVPHDWVTVMKNSIRTITPEFSTARMVGEYWSRAYAPVAERGRRFAANNLEVAQRVGAYKQFVRTSWDSVYIQDIKLSPHEDGTRVQACIRLGRIWHADVRVEAVGSDGHGGIWKQELRPVTENAGGKYLFECDYPNRIEVWRKANANIRVVPISPDFCNDFELELTSWGTNWR
ncbi:alpha-glucan family phosphorylase [Tumebacillus sp. ITR2]|uniref:Alpha-glucan family phosphorylase n=1 Tax=Tumebacillus amylolyticus TaxID=2801339 RepID=A0ABS1J7F9_9BACL|nr:alpha-glucan family phosphorylase [Tumebacillus amylolyticus]MBL0386207.1 alpha-glucan family phosphorylase [Tumebacillus amylolyticus]